MIQKKKGRANSAAFLAGMEAETSPSLARNDERN
jgi:hypothetical protein